MVSLLEGQVKYEVIVQTNIFSPGDRSETKVRGSVSSAKAPVPETTLHMPFPKLGALALRL